MELKNDFFPKNTVDNKDLTIYDYYRIYNYWDKMCDEIPDLKKLKIKDFLKFKKELKGAKMKSGWRTTEFWTSVGTSIVGILVVLGWITPDFQQDMPGLIEKLTGGVISIVSVVSYIWSRTKVKSSNKV